MIERSLRGPYSRPAVTTMSFWVRAHEPPTERQWYSYPRMNGLEGKVSRLSQILVLIRTTEVFLVVIDRAGNQARRPRRVSQKARIGGSLLG